MRYKIVFQLGLALFLFSACEKEETIEHPKPTVFSDFGVKYSSYIPLELYTSDTFQTKFNITNYGPATFSNGDTVWAAVEINSVTYSLDLTGPGPTAIIVPGEIFPQSSFEFNPGYLLRNPTLDFFNKDTVDITILLYGQNGSPIDKTFPKDPTPANNKTTLRLTTDNFYLLE